MTRDEKHLEKLFEDFMREVYPDACQNQYECLKDAWFAAAGITLTRLLDATDLPDEESFPIISDLENEIHGYADLRADQALERMETNGGMN